MGFGPVTPERAVDWTLQIDVAGHPAAQRAKRIDARLPASLIALPTQISGSEPGTDYASLANRDLQRGQAVGLASGEAIARRLGVPPLSPEEVGLAERGWTGETPLWFYILKEAEVLHAGEQLGPVGGRDRRRGPGRHHRRRPGVIPLRGARVAADPARPPRGELRPGRHLGPAALIGGCQAPGSRIRLASGDD